MMVRSIRRFLLGLIAILAAAALIPTHAQAADKAPPHPASDVKAPGDRAGGFALPGEDPPAPFVPLHPRSVEDQQRIEAVRDYSAARALEFRRNLSDAIDLLEEAHKIEPDSIAVHRRLSELCFALGRTDAALKYSKQVLEADPNDTETLSQLVAYYTRKGDPSGAESALKGVLANQKLAKNSSGRLLTLYELGKLYAGRLQQMDKAADALAEVVEALDERTANRLSPHDQKLILGDDPAGTYLDFGIIFLAAKRNDLALKSFERGLIYNEDHPQIPLHMAQTLLNTGKAEAALRLVEDYLKRQPQGIEAYELLAKILTALKRENEITPRLEQAAKLDPNNIPLQYVLADRYRETGQGERAEALYKALLSAQPSSQAYGALAASLLKRKKTEELLKVISEAIARPGGAEAIGPQLEAIKKDSAYAEELLDVGLKRLSADPANLDRPTMIVLAHIANGIDKLDKLADLQRLVLRHNASPLAYRELAETLVRLRKYDEAADIIDQLMAKYPDEKNARQLVMLGKIRRAADQLDPATEAVREALKLEPNDTEAESLLAILLSQTGKIDEAVEILRSALKLKPDEIELNRLLGALLGQFGRNDEAIVLYKGLLERYPNNDEMVKFARSGLSVVYVNQGEFAKGEAELEALLERTPDDAGVNNDLGYLYADQGKDLEKAEQMIRKAVQEEPDSSAYLDSLGWVLFKRGKVKEAVAPLEQAVKNLNAGGDATIYEHLGDVYLRLNERAKAKAAWEKAEKAAAKAVPPDRRLPEIRKKLEDLKKLGMIPKPAAPDAP
jgi:tetratricopeptide (TPR) repeat protein